MKMKQFQSKSTEILPGQRIVKIDDSIQIEEESIFLKWMLLKAFSSLEDFVLVMDDHI